MLCSLCWANLTLVISPSLPPACTGTKLASTKPNKGGPSLGCMKIPIRSCFSANYRLSYGSPSLLSPVTTSWVQPRLHTTTAYRGLRA